MTQKELEQHVGSLQVLLATHALVNLPTSTASEKSFVLSNAAFAASVVLAADELADRLGREVDGKILDKAHDIVVSSWETMLHKERNGNWKYEADQNKPENEQEQSTQKLNQ